MANGEELLPGVLDSDQNVLPTTPIPTPAPTPTPTEETFGSAPIGTPQSLVTAAPTPTQPQDEISGLIDRVAASSADDPVIDPRVSPLPPKDFGELGRVDASELPTQLPTDISRSGRPPLIDRSELGDIGTNALNSLSNNLSAAGRESADNRVTRPLKERTTLAHHFDTVVQRDPNGVRVGVKPIGVTSNGTTQGSSKPFNLFVTPDHFKQFAQSSALYLSRFSQMTPEQQNLGALRIFFDTARPHIQRREAGDTRQGPPVPSFEVMASVVDGLSIYNQWGNLDNVQRFRNTANELVGTARSLGYGDKIPTQVTNSLAHLNFGYAAHNLFDNWNHMNPVERVVGVTHAIQQGSQAFSNLATLARTASGTAVTGANTILAGGSAAASGAAASSVATPTVLQAGGVNTAAGSQAALSGQLQSFALYAGGILGAYQIIDGWGTGGAQGRMNGASGGAAVGASIGDGPGAVIGAIVGLAIGSIHSGKSRERMKRDSLRNHYEQNGVFTKREGSSHHLIELADGSFYDVGFDSSSRRATNPDGSVKTFANPDRIAERDKDSILDNGELRPYDIDYTNDLDFVAHLATKGVNLLPVGGSVAARETKEVDQMNGYLTNAATSGIGRELTEDNFKSVMANVRGFYGKLGIESIEDGMEIAQELREDRRLSKDDFNAMVLGFQFAFSEDFERAQELMSQLNRDKAPVNVPAGEFEELREQDRGEL